MTIKAVIFDMDGVLIDAKEWHYESLNRALMPHNAQIGRSEHLSTFDGLPTRTKLELLSQTRGLPRELHASIQQAKQEYLFELVNERCRPKLHHIRALRGLREAGFVLGLASNSIRETVDLMLTKACLLQYFDFTLSNQDVPKPKPEPDIYLAAARMAGIEPEACVVIEDNQHGVMAATRAGAQVLQVETVDDVVLSRIESFIAQIERQAMRSFAA